MYFFSPSETTPDLTRLAVYLINLDRATARRERMHVVLSATELDYERVSAVDGRTLRFPHADFHAFHYKVLHGRRTIPAEVGCYLSHVACARKLLTCDATHALVLEDDVAFPPNFQQLLRDVLDTHGDWDILRLSTVNSGRKFAYRDLNCGRRLAVALTREKGAGAYIINRAAATWISQRLLPMRLSWDIAFDLEYLAGLRAVFVVPVPVSQREEAESQIQGDVKDAKLPRWRYLTVFPYRTWLEISRVGLRFASYGRLCWRWRRVPSRRDEVG